MHSASVTKKSLFSVAVCALLVAAPAKATVYNEAVSGDLSDDKAAPTALTLTPGFNSVIGTVAGFPEFGGTDPQDWVSFTIPTGFVMTSYVNARFVSSDPQGFTGFQVGSSFPGDEFAAGSYAGYAHFGTAADNGGGSGSTVGDLLAGLPDDSEPLTWEGFLLPGNCGNCGAYCPIAPYLEAEVMLCAKCGQRTGLPVTQRIRDAASSVMLRDLGVAPQEILAVAQSWGEFRWLRLSR